MTREEQIAKLSRAVSAAFSVFRATPREKLRWVTTIIYAVVVGLDDDVEPELRDEVEGFHIKRRAAFMQSGCISRNTDGQTRWAGVLELDLLHPHYVCSDMKTELLSRFGIKVAALQSIQRILILHEHAIIDWRGHASAEALMRDLRAAYPGPRRVHSAHLYSDGTVAQNLNMVAGYCTKFVHRYSAAWGGKRTTYFARYEPEWRDWVLAAYEKIGYHRLLNANVKTQAAVAEKGSGMYGAHLISEGEIAEDGPLQLTPSGSPTTDTKYNLIKPSHSTHNTNRSSGDDGDTMRAREIIDSYIDPDKMEPGFRRAIEDAIARQGPGMSPELMLAMYGDSVADLKAKQQRADLLKTQAETARLMAAVDRDRAETRSLGAGT